ncbi:hypothetical protein T01_4986 [Trichinella spiralis]|uniref:Uncharacterized protein n=1 Tax=Trichinella spiralis TaxID=6334 RepID=A0A0V1ALP0_TRISP|nr:hypothetical protein T01_4986 [Trichinella spiralis]
MVYGKYWISILILLSVFYSFGNVPYKCVFWNIVELPTNAASCVENAIHTSVVEFIGATSVTAETGIKACPAIQACFHKDCQKEKCEAETSHISFNATLPESPKGFHL